MEPENEPLVTCGICHKVISAVKISPAMISPWDKENSRAWRKVSFNCCGRTWLIGNDDEPFDAGPEILK
jgi:hypothetical protein